MAPDPEGGAIIDPMAKKHKVKKQRRLSELRVAEAISDFQETLPSFCETMLSSGSRSGNEWQVPDLDNSPRHDGKPGSCCVNLETGCFYDHNPAAEPQKGGPVHLWTALFGATDFLEIILGMEAWVKDGSLPDGFSGVVRTKKIETPCGETLVARDATERIWLENIQYRQKSIERKRGGNLDVLTSQWDHTPMLDRPSDDGALLLILKKGSHDFLHYEEGSDKGESYHDFLLRGNNYKEEKERQIAYCQMLIRSAYSKIHAHRWRKAVEETQSSREEAAEVLAEYRGLKPKVFLWLINNGYVALYESNRLSARFGGKWQSIEIAFPVTRDGRWPGRRIGFRVTKNGKWPWQEGVADFYKGGQPDYPDDLYKPDLEFLGMHLKWFSDNGQSGWRYEPKGNGCGSVPFIIGDLPAADLVLIGESTWDVISFIDLYRLFEWGPNRSWAAIDTGGASNAKRIPADRIKPDATILLLLQNDSNGANDHWCAGLPLSIRERGRRIIPPNGVKDLNDWMRAASAEEIKKTLEHK
jgi:hypothetical protein